MLPLSRCRLPTTGAKFTGSLLFRSYRRSKSGATAVEFALISPFFLGLLLGIIEVALTFWSTQVLETAVAAAAREIYTGSYQESASGKSAAPDALRDFKGKVCSRVKALFNCDRLVKVDVREFNDYSAASLGVPVTGGVFDTSGFGYQQCNREKICVVRAAMEYPVYVNLLGYRTGLTNGNRLIMASATFMIEPF